MPSTGKQSLDESLEMLQITPAGYRAKITSFFKIVHSVTDVTILKSEVGL